MGDFRGYYACAPSFQEGGENQGIFVGLRS